jgi:hypothetical protein
MPFSKETTKFSHDKVAMRCNGCMLPDEIKNAGPQAIARWRRKPVGWVEQESGIVVKDRLDSLSKRARKRQRLLHGARASRKLNKHGRQNAPR